MSVLDRKSLANKLVDNVNFLLAHAPDGRREVHDDGDEYGEDGDNNNDNNGDKEEHHRGSSTGMVVAGVIILVVLIAVAVFVLCYLSQRRTRNATALAMPRAPMPSDRVLPIANSGAPPKSNGFFTQ